MSEVVIAVLAFISMAVACGFYYYLARYRQFKMMKSPSNENLSTMTQSDPEPLSSNP
jgi:hypothetical protein